jgi:hypothetical protein
MDISTNMEPHTNPAILISEKFQAELELWLASANSCEKSEKLLKKVPKCVLSFISHNANRPWFHAYAIHEVRVLTLFDANVRSCPGLYCGLVATKEGWLVCAKSEVDIHPDYWMDRILEAFGMSPDSDPSKN